MSETTTTTRHWHDLTGSEQVDLHDAFYQAHRQTDIWQRTTFTRCGIVPGRYYVAFDGVRVGWVDRNLDRTWNGTAVGLHPDRLGRRAAEHVRLRRDAADETIARVFRAY